MSNIESFQVLSETEVAAINGGGLLDLLQPLIIVNDPLGVVGLFVDPVLTGGLNAMQSITVPLMSNINSIVTGLLGGLRL